MGGGGGGGGGDVRGGAKVGGVSETRARAGGKNRAVGIIMQWHSIII